MIWRGIASTFLTLLVVILIGMAIMVAWGRAQYTSPGPSAAAQCVTVAQGASLNAVSQQLLEQGVVSSAYILRTGADYEGKANQLKFGSYLVPRLVRGGHEVIALSRGAREPYHPSAQWASVSRVTVDRDAEDEAGTFGGRIADLRPDVVMDMLCYTPGAAAQLVEALRPSRPLLIHCGTIWVHGNALRVPVTEDEPRTAYGEYGTGKAAIEARPELAEVRFAMPNRHHFLCDLEPFGLENRGEVFYAADRPYGLIEGTVHRDGAAPAPGAWLDVPTSI